MKYIVFIVTALCSALFLGGCRSTRQLDPTVSMANYTTTCLGTNLDGRIVVRAWARGANRAQAVEQAVKNALNAVIFKGITDGKTTEASKPLVFEVNAEEKYESYFNRFFADNGEYMRYGVEEPGNYDSRVEAKTSTQGYYGVVVLIDRAALKQRLKDDYIIKP